MIVSTEVIIQGTLKPDGSLELDQKPGLLPGRVQVVLRPVPPTTPTRQGLAEVIQRIERDQAARGYKGISAADIAAEETLRRQEDEDYEARCQAIWSQTQSGQPR